MEFRRDLDHKIDNVLGDMRGSADIRSQQVAATSKLKDKVMDYLSEIGRNHKESESQISSMKEGLTSIRNKILDKTAKKMSDKLANAPVKPISPKYAIKNTTKLPSVMNHKRSDGTCICPICGNVHLPGKAHLTRKPAKSLTGTVKGGVLSLSATVKQAGKAAISRIGNAFAANRTKRLKTTIKVAPPP